MFWFTLALVLFTSDDVFGYEVSRSPTPEERLHEYLFSDQFHNLTVFPKEKGSIDLFFQVKLFGADIETESETLSIDVNFIQKWKNPRLQWKPEDFDNITEINIDPELAWVPDLYIHSNIEEDKDYNGMLNTLLTKIILKHDGSEIWLAPSTLVVRCVMDIQNYPFDTQRCPLQFGSFSFDSSRMNVNVAPIDLDLYEDPPEWELLSADHSKEYVTYSSSNVPFTDSIYVLILKRKALAPLKLLVLPNLVFIALTFIVFQIPTDAGERIGYLFTTFLAIAFFLTDTIGTLPLSSIDVPLCMKFMGISTISLSLLALCLCYSIGCYYANINLVTLPDNFRSFVRKASKVCSVNTERNISKWRQMLDEVRSIENASSECKNTAHNDENKDVEESDYAEVIFKDSIEELFPNKIDLSTFHSKLDTILKSFEEEDEVKWRQKEWQQFSKILDHICFAVFLSYFVLSLLFVNIRIFMIY